MRNTPLFIFAPRLKKSPEPPAFRFSANRTISAARAEVMMKTESF
jgi:hypothetical protein